VEKRLLHQQPDHARERACGAREPQRGSSEWLTNGYAAHSDTLAVSFSEKMVADIGEYTS